MCYCVDRYREILKNNRLFIGKTIEVVETNMKLPIKVQYRDNDGTQRVYNSNVDMMYCPLCGELLKGGM